jgi:hypothetical protein
MLPQDQAYLAAPALCQLHPSRTEAEIMTSDVARRQRPPAPSVRSRLELDLCPYRDHRPNEE